MLEAGVRIQSCCSILSKISSFHQIIRYAEEHENATDTQVKKQAVETLRELR